MNKIVPFLTFAVSLLGAVFSVSGFALALLSFFLGKAVIIPAVVFLVIGCIINAFPILGGIIFNSKLCKAAMIIGIISYAAVLIAFILLLAR